MVEEAIGRKAVEVKAPAERPAEYFGKYVFDRDKMRKYLPKACFETLMNTMKNGSPLDRETADCVAAGMKQWAQDMGATHYTLRRNTMLLSRPITKEECWKSSQESC